MIGVYLIFSLSDAYSLTFHIFPREAAHSLYTVFYEADCHPGFHVGSFDEVVGDMSEGWRDVFFSFVQGGGHVLTYSSM